MLSTKIKNYFFLLPYCVELFYDLLICKILIVFFPFRFYAKTFGTAHYETFFFEPHYAKKMLSSIKIVSRKIPPFLPWKSKCLDQAMAAQRMLKRRGLATTLYFGFTKNKNTGTINAHAWVRSGSFWITGYQPGTQFTTVGIYSTDSDNAKCPDFVTQFRKNSHRIA